MIRLSDKELWQFYLKENQSKFSCVNNAHEKTLDIYWRRHETLLQTYTQFCYRRNI